MGFSKKSQVGRGADSDGKKWVVVSARTGLKPVNTKQGARDEGEKDSRSTTPTSREARIPEKLMCPPAPVKQRPPLRCNYNGAAQFFTPPDLETVFNRHVETAN